MIQLRAIPNQKTVVTFECEPWSFVPTIPEEALKDKATFAKWSNALDTEYAFFTASEGVNPALRCNKQNPIRRLHGIIGDYDIPISESMEDGLVNAPPDMRPTWISTSFSGHRRLLWLFEEPLPIDPAIVKPFLTIAKDVLRARKLLPALDEPAWLDLYKTFAVGSDWRRVGDKPLSTSTLHYWLIEAAKKAKWEAGVKIPISVIAEEVEKRYPGRWDGPFEEGKRGPAFFDPNSTNPTSSVVTEDGLITFSQEKLFYTWGELFPELARTYQADKIGGAVANTWFDGKCYYRKINGVWMHVAKEDYVKWLCAVKGLDKGTGRNENASETTRAEVFVQEQHRVYGVVPRVFDPRDVLDINGQRFLNCAYVTAVEPADEHQEWGENFPWIANFLDTCFDPPEQKEFFLGWLKRFYCSALAGDLLKGHAMFIVGPVELGKTLLGTRIVGGLLGGYADASDFVSSSTEFNKQLLEVGLWTVDDSKSSTDAAAHRRFSEMIKRLVANPGFNYRAMFRDSQRTEWNGRIIVTLNDDVYSLQMIPDLEVSMTEKVMIFKFSSAAREFPPKHVLENTIAAELPFLGRWLRDWEIPTEFIGTNRLGVRGYIHEDIRVRSLHAGGVGDLLELVDIWVKQSCPPDKYPEGQWEGTASEWMSNVGSNEALRPLVQKFTPKMLGKRFSEASRIRESRIEVAESSAKRGNRYRITFDPDIVKKGATRVVVDS